MSFKQKLKNKELTIGSWLSIANPAIAEIMAKSGYEWLAIDMEHSSLSIDQCQELIRVIDLCNVSPLVRVGANDPLLIKQAMDAGAHGVIVPMVGSKADAQNVVNAVHYPPKGNRGVGLSRAQGYGQSFEEYKQWLEKESIIIAQIEHIDGVHNLDEILDVEEIDAVIVGPYDLSGSIGDPGNFDTDEMKKALSKIEAVTLNKGVSLGYHVVFPKAQAAKEMIAKGYNLIAFGVDFLFLGESCKEGLKNIQNLNIDQLSEIKKVSV